MGPGALLMLLLFFSQHCEVFVCREQERYSLSLSRPLEAGQGGILLQNVLPVKGEEQDHIWRSLRVISTQPRLRTASPLRRFAGGERRAGAARSAGVRSQPPWRREEGFSSSDVTEPRGALAVAPVESAL